MNQTYRYRKFCQCTYNVPGQSPYEVQKPFILAENMLYTDSSASSTRTAVRIDTLDSYAYTSTGVRHLVGPYADTLPNQSYPAWQAADPMIEGGWEPTTGGHSHSSVLPLPYDSRIDEVAARVITEMAHIADTTTANYDKEIHRKNIVNNACSKYRMYLDDVMEFWLPIRVWTGVQSFSNFTNATLSTTYYLRFFLCGTLWAMHEADEEENTFQGFNTLDVLGLGTPYEALGTRYVLTGSESFAGGVEYVKSYNPLELGVYQNPAASNMAGYVCTSAQAAATDALMELLVTAIEGREAVGMLIGTMQKALYLMELERKIKKDPTAAIAMLRRKAKSARFYAGAIRTASDCWLEWRYGWRQLYFDCRSAIDVADFIQGTKKLPTTYSRREVFPSIYRGFKYEELLELQPTEASERKLLDDPLYCISERPLGDSSATVKRSFSGKVFGLTQIRGGVGVGKRSMRKQIYDALGGLNLVKATWELIPDSFVVDWFFDIASLLARASIYRSPTNLFGYPKGKAYTVLERGYLTVDIPPGSLIDGTAGLGQEDILWSLDWAGLKSWLSPEFQLAQLDPDGCSVPYPVVGTLGAYCRGVYPDVRYMPIGIKDPQGSNLKWQQLADLASMVISNRHLTGG